MPLKPWKKISGENKFKNPWWTYRVDKYKLPSGKGGKYHYVHTGGAVMIVPILDNRKILMVKQFRYLNQKESLEFPKGGMKDNEKPEEIARKELIEEASYDGKLEKVGHFNPYNGITDETTHIFISRNLESSSKETKDDSEEFEKIELTPEEIDQKIKTNEIYDGMTIAAWAIARDYLK